MNDRLGLWAYARFIQWKKDLRRLSGRLQDMTEDCKENQMDATAATEVI